MKIEEKVVDLYKRGNSMYAIGFYLDMSERKVRKILIENNIELRRGHDKNTF